MTDYTGPMTMKWWGWGAPDKTYALDARPKAWPWLKAKLGVTEEVHRPPVDSGAIQLPPARLAVPALEALAGAVGEVNVTTQAGARLTHAYGKSYRDLVRIRAGEVGNPPDAVVYPTQEGHVEAVLALAATHGFAVIPFGGGSSVVGGLEMPADQAERPFVSLDLSRLAEVLVVDKDAMTATIQAGMMGPKLEEALQAQGVTLGHFPQSFEFSSLGGWIATRSAGQQSTRYGKIEDMVVGVRCVTPVGTYASRPVPAAAQGPDLDQVVVGSEGVLGVITQATVRVHAAPERRNYRALIFADWAHGLAAVREVMQAERHPATMRLSDVAETAALFKLREGGQSSPARDLMQEAFKWYLRRLRGIDPGRGCLMVLGFEGGHDEVEHDLHVVKDRLEGHRAFDMGAGIGEKWYEGRFELPYMRDTLLDRGILVDTLETSATWDRIPALYQGVTDALTGAIAADGLPPLVFCHVSHPYHEGASLYFTFMARQAPDDPLGQWMRYKRAATEAIIAHGGALSHHHGVGLDHAPWTGAAIGAEGVRWLRALKAAADPAGVMNPGKILG